MPPADKNAVTNAPALAAKSRIGEAPTLAFWSILTFFDKQMMSPAKAFRNTLGVALPLIIGFALGMPRGGLVMGSGA